MRILAIIGALAIVTGIGAAVFFFGGYYNVAGTAEDPSIIRWALIQVRSASISRYANDVPPATISDPASVQAGANRTPSQLFWVVKNGINMTGMPSFALAGAKDDEIWSAVAFLKKLPSIKEADYKVWTAPPPPPAAPVATPPPPAVAPTPPAENK
jgi:hypothetical protein